MTKTKKRISFGTVSITDEAKRLIKEILDSNRVSSGKYVRAFEKDFAEVIGTKEAIAVSSGTDADCLALAVLYDFGAKRGDEVIIPALSFVATGNAVLQAGFEPAFVDIDKKTLNIDPAGIEGAITKKTRAIMPVHLMGKPADMDAINAIARKHNLFVIEDAAEAYGAVYKGRPVGTLGDMAAFSLYVAHMITTVEGGMVVTDRADFAEVLRSLRSHGRACKCESCVLNTSSGYCDKRFSHGGNRDIRFMFERIGFSTKMNELEAAVGLGNIKTYPDILKRRRKNILYMIDKFKEFAPYLYTIEEGENEEIGPHAFAIIIDEGARFRRDELVYFLEQHGIDTRNLFLSMPTQCAGFEYLGKKIGEFPNAEYMGDKGLHIGIHQDMDREELDYALDVIRDFLAKQ
ncbi:MAG: DegT/DnrJ/EryC1/StrS family aminotransferase [Candidatus Omnitrophota bacterium]|nr:MAG: DegT/DnrJ/EryC1/StrS family aminotransferase [Candidatus Omnitrophota bacterium]